MFIMAPHAGQCVVERIGTAAAFIRSFFAEAFEEGIDGE